MNAMKELMLLLIAVGIMFATLADASSLAEWESAMCVHRPHLSAKATRSPRMLAAKSLSANDSVQFDEIVSRALGAMRFESAEWTRAFESDEESVDVCSFVLDGNVEGRFAVYGQLGNYAPYYWLVDGLDVGQDCTLAEFLEAQGLTGEGSVASIVDGLLCDADVEIAMQEEDVIAPYGRFYFAFVDDMPGANWAHPCRYVFVADDFSGFTVLYKNWRPSLVWKDTRERIPLVRVGAPASDMPEKLDDVKNRVYGYARSLAANGISYQSGDKGRSYFVLVSGGGSPESNGIRFWSDTAMLYSTLTRKYGIAKDNIYTYISDGNSPGKDANLSDGDSPVLVDSPKDLDGDGIGDVTDAASKDNLKRCLSNLGKTLTANDQLLIFMTSHGGPDGISGVSNFDCSISLFGSSLRDDELADMTKRIRCPVAVAVECCYSGGFVDDICATSNRAIATACNHYESSWGYGGGGAWTDDSLGKTSACNIWTGPLIAAFRGFWPKPARGSGYPWEDGSAVNPDSNGDGVVSFAEAAVFAIENDSEEAEHPQYRSTNKIGDSFFIRNHFPYEMQLRSVLLNFLGGMEGPCAVKGKGDEWRLRDPLPYWVESCSLSNANGTVSLLTSDAAVLASGDLYIDVVAKKNESVSDGRDCEIAIYNVTAGRVEYTISVSQEPVRPTYVVTFNPGAHGDGEVQTAEKTKGVALTLPGAVFTRFGYAQTGWSTSDGGSKRYGLAEDYTNNVAATFYPYWTGNTYEIRLDCQGGSSGTVVIPAHYGSMMPSITVPRRTGYVFMGYYSSPDGTGTKYYDEGGGGLQVWDLASETTLYAQWTPITYDVTFDLQGGTGGVSVVSACYDSPMPQIEVPVRAGYVFCGFFGGTNGSGTKYYNSDGTSAALWNKAKATMLYASWSLAVYNVTLDMQGGSGDVGFVSSTYKKTMPSVVPPVLPGYVFMGYYSGLCGSGEKYYGMDGKGSRAWNTAGDGTLYAHWVALGFSDCEIAVREGAKAKISVMGGDLKTNSSVRVCLAYQTASAADVNVGSYSFPVTLKWAAGEIGEKTVSIPVKTDALYEGDEILTLNLTDATNMLLGGSSVCIVKITDANKPSVPSGAVEFEGGYYVVSGGYATAKALPGFVFVSWVYEATGKQYSASTKISDSLRKSKNVAPKFEVATCLCALVDNPETGTVKGQGLYAVEKTVTLTAQPKKGYVFTGWRRPAVTGEQGIGNGVVSLETSFKVNAGEDVSTYVATFKKESELARPVVTLADSTGSTSSDATSGNDRTLSVGVSYPATLSVAGESKVSITKVKGLPTGLTYKNGKISGVPTKAGKFTTSVTVTLASNKKKAWTAKVPFTVAALPEWARGVFSGIVIPANGEWGTGNGEQGASATMSIGTTGKVSGKFALGGTNWTFSASSFAKDSVVTGEVVRFSAAMNATGTWKVYDKKTKKYATKKVKLPFGFALVADPETSELASVTEGGYFGATVFEGEPPVVVSEPGAVEFRRNAGVRVTKGGATAGGSVSLSAALGQAAAGKTVKATAKLAKGYALLGWYSADNELLGQALTYSVKMDGSDVFLVAKFKKESELAKPVLSWGGEAWPDVTETNLTVGVAYSAALSVEGEAKASVTKVTGLPTGLAWKGGKISGVPTKAGKFTVTVTAALSTNAKKTWTYKQSLAVSALPAYAKGSFMGAATVDNYYVVGLAAVSVGSTGAISGKFFDNGTNWTFSAASYTGIEDGVFVCSNLVASYSWKSGKTTKKATRPFALHVDQLAIDEDNADSAVLGHALAEEIVPEEGPEPVDVVAWQNLWGSKYKAIGNALFYTSAKKLYKEWPSVAAEGLGEYDALSMKVTTAGAVTATLKHFKGTFDAKTKKPQYETYTCTTTLIPLTSPEAGAETFTGGVPVFFPATGYFAQVEFPFAGRTVPVPAQE